MITQSEAKRKLQRDQIRSKHISILFREQRAAHFGKQNSRQNGNNSKKKEINNILKMQNLERNDVQKLWISIVNDDDRCLDEKGFYKLLEYMQNQMGVYRVVKNTIMQQQSNLSLKNARIQELDECQENIIRILWIIASQSYKLESLSDQLNERMLLFCIQFLTKYLQHMQKLKEQGKKLASVLLGNICESYKSSKIITDNVKISELLKPERKLLQNQDFSFCLSNIMYYYPMGDGQKWPDYEQELYQILQRLKEKVRDELSVYKCKDIEENRFYFINDILQCILKVRYLLSDSEPLPKNTFNKFSLSADQYIAHKIIQFTQTYAKFFNRNMKGYRKDQILMYLLIFIRDVLRLSDFDQIAQQSLQAYFLASSVDMLRFLHQILMSQFEPTENHLYISDCGWQILDNILIFLKSKKAEQILGMHQPYASSQTSNHSQLQDYKSLYESQLRWLEIKVIQSKVQSGEQNQKSVRKSRKLISSDQISRALKVFINHLGQQMREQDYINLLGVFLSKLQDYLQACLKVEIILTLDGIKKITENIKLHCCKQGQLLKIQTILGEKYDLIESLLYKFTEEQSSGEEIHQLVNQILYPTQLELQQEDEEKEVQQTKPKL